MTKIHQLLAVEKGVRRRTHDEISRLHHLVTREPLLNGQARVYQPKEDGEGLPPESVQVRVKATEVLHRLEQAMTNLFDITLTKDTANTFAKADVVVDGNTLLEGAPVSYLLFLEKQLQDVRTFVHKLPVLEPGIDWTWDRAQSLYASDPVETTRSRKVPQRFVRAEATEHHPAQVDVYHEDVVVGTWTTTRYSGALPREQVELLTERVEKLLDAVKVARESANSADVVDKKAGEAIFGYLFEGV